MKKISFYLVFLSIIFVLNFKNSPQNSIKLTLTKKKSNFYHLKIEIKEGFGIQISAPNRILLGPSNGLKITQANLKLKGTIHEKNLEYYKKIDYIPIQVDGKGKLHINAKLYFCNLEQKICIPGKFNLTKQIN